MPMLMRRSLIKMGDGGLVITIPRAWARYYGLRPGDKVEVISNGEITIRPNRKELEVKKVIAETTEGEI